MRRWTLLVAAATSLSLAAPAHGKTAGTVPGSAAFPESIAVAPAGKTLYVSSFATGAVVKGAVGGALGPFLVAGADGRASATGVEFDAGGRLLVLTGHGVGLQIADVKTGRLVGRLAAGDGLASNLNDLVVTKDGDAYITESGTPAVYKATGRQLAKGKGGLTRWLAPAASSVPSDPAKPNLNGIALTPDERYLLVGETSNGNLYRIELATRSVKRIAVTGGSLTGSDGILLRKQVLYVVTHTDGVKKVTLNAKFTKGSISATLTDPTLNFPTSIAAVGGKLVVTNGLKPEGAADYSLTSFAG